jgi:hypothetical protein
MITELIDLNGNEVEVLYDFHEGDEVMGYLDRINPPSPDEIEINKVFWKDYDVTNFVSHSEIESIIMFKIETAHGR